MKMNLVGVNTVVNVGAADNYGSNPIDDQAQAPEYTFVDLFAGCGGFHYTLKKYAKCVFASEWDPKARQTYQLNHLAERTFPFAEDITEVDPVDIPDHDVLCAGLPCQPFSIAGSLAGFEHTQGTLFFDVEQILYSKKPRALLLENVKHLIKHDDGRTFGIIQRALKRLGYHIKYKVLNATTYGNLPQNRERVYIVGFLDIEACERFEFPGEIPLESKVFGNIVNVSDRKADNYYQTNTSSPAVARMHEHIRESGVVYQDRRGYIRANKSSVCPTLTASMGTGGNNVPLVMDDYGIRKLTPRECFDLQGFPADFIFPSGMADNYLYKQAGNSIPIAVVSRIAANIFRALSKPRRE